MWLIVLCLVLQPLSLNQPRLAALEVLHARTVLTHSTLCRCPH
jgi:hypothetical protein